MKKELVFRITLALAVIYLVIQFGIMPLFSKDFIYDARRNNTWAHGKLGTEKGVYDVVVIGEEPDGIAAAVSAARVGAKTLLVSFGDDLGGSVTECMLTDLEASTGTKGELLNKGIFEEISDKCGKSFSVDKYKKTVEKLVRNERNIDVVYKAKAISPVIDKNVMTSIDVISGGVKKSCKGRMFIDATPDGELLMKLKTPFFNGSGDLSLPDKYMPASFNFTLDGVKADEVESLVKSGNKTFIDGLKKYKPSHLNMKINEFSISDQGNGTFIVHGIDIFNVNPLDNDSVNKAYNEAVSEAKDLAFFLKNEFKEFRGAKFGKPANSLYMREERHFKGEHVLKVNEVLENKDSMDKIALGSYPVEAGKFTEGASQIIGKPFQYAVPIGCIIPVNTSNVLMTGKKISYSSLAASSAGKLGVNIGTGEAAGIVAVYSIMKGIKPRDIISSENSPGIKDIDRLLKRQGVVLPDFNIKNKLSGNWVYAELEDLRELGIVSGGYVNDYGLEAHATQGELAMLLLNGAYRLAPDKYTLEFDSRLRVLFKKDKLTPELAGETLAALYGVKTEPGQGYKTACENGYINGAIQLRLKGKSILTFDDVVYLTDYNIKQFAGK